jgi:hypothetical protein
LKALIRQRETPELRQEAEAALNSKWTGVQVCAARVLAKWGGRRSVELLKTWVEKWYWGDRHKHFAMQHTASDILAECIEPQDADWVLNTYLTIGYETVGRFALWRCIEKLRFAAVQERLARESTSDNRSRRMATLDFLIGLKKPTTVRELVKRFLEDPDPEIKREARVYIESAGGDW